MSITTIAQRGEAFLVRLDQLDPASHVRVYDASLQRLYPALPEQKAMKSTARAIRATHEETGRAPVEWEPPSRSITPAEIDAAERVHPAK